MKNCRLVSKAANSVGGFSIGTSDKIPVQDLVIIDHKSNNYAVTSPAGHEKENLEEWAIRIVLALEYLRDHSPGSIKIVAVHPDRFEALVSALGVTGSIIRLP